MACALLEEAVQDPIGYVLRLSFEIWETVVVPSVEITAGAVAGATTGPVGA
jgi:hypothetical protein